MTIMRKKELEKLLEKAVADALGLDVKQQIRPGAAGRTRSRENRQSPAGHRRPPVAA